MTKKHFDDERSAVSLSERICKPGFVQGPEMKA